MTSSTFELRVSSDCREHFDLAMKIAWDNCPGKVATQYTLSPERGMVFFWGAGDCCGKEARPLPYPMDLTAAAEFIWNWLKTAEPGHEPDHDGSNEQGWLLECGNDVKRLLGSPYAFLAVKPVWHEYWK